MTLAKRYTCSQHSVYNVSYHIVFCTKFRRKVLVDGAEDRLKELFIEKARELGVLIEKMKVEPDRVDFVVRSKPTYAVHFVVHQLKAYSFRILRKEYDFIRSRLPTLWTRSYFVETVGHISEETMLGYIEDQKKV